MCQVNPIRLVPYVAHFDTPKNEKIEGKVLIYRYKISESVGRRMLDTPCIPNQYIALRLTAEVTRSKQTHIPVDCNKFTVLATQRRQLNTPKWRLLLLPVGNDVVLIKECIEPTGSSSLQLLFNLSL